jgi:hypothetical protein
MKQKGGIQRQSGCIANCRYFFFLIAVGFSHGVQSQFLPASAKRVVWLKSYFFFVINPSAKADSNKEPSIERKRQFGMHQPKQTFKQIQKNPILFATFYLAITIRIMATRAQARPAMFVPESLSLKAR